MRECDESKNESDSRRECGGSKNESDCMSECDEFSIEVCLISLHEVCCGPYSRYC